MAHQCRAALLFCMDFRFHDQLAAFIAAEGLDQDGVDVIRVAGAAKNLARPGRDRDREFVLEQVKTSRRIHQVRQIYLVNHEDCGAYGPEDIPDTAEELAIHRKDLLAAAGMLKGLFGELEILPYYMWLSGQTDRVR